MSDHLVVDFKWKKRLHKKSTNDEEITPQLPVSRATTYRKVACKKSVN